MSLKIMQQAFLLIFLLAFSPIFAQKSLKDFHSVTVKRPDCKRIVWKNAPYDADDPTPTIGFVDAKKKFHKITMELDILMHIDSIAVSPKYKNMLVFSSGEGHPMLVVYPIIDVIKNNKASKGKMLNPYPMWTNKEEWLDDDTIRFTSEVDFDIDGKGTYKEDAKEKIWIWYLKMDKVLIQRLKTEKL
jgi:hypothetical protein